MDTIYYFALLILCAFVVAKALSVFRLPDVTGYLIAGLLIGPSVFKLMPQEAVTSFATLSDIALGFIAFNIGSEMEINSIKKLGKKIISITALEASCAWIFVFVVMMALGRDVAFSMVIGSIASATAPAATIMVIKQYRAKGPVVDTLMPVVALDDAFCIIAFGISSSIGLNLMKGGAPSFYNMLLSPLLQIFAAIALGLVAGLIAIFIINLITNTNDITIYVCGMVVLLTYVALKLGLSSLLAIMCFGLMIGNFGQHKRFSRRSLTGVSVPIYVAFFCLSGANLNLSVLSEAGIFGAAYVLARAFGKFFGAFSGSAINKMEKTVRNTLGFTLLPQAGVAIGLSQVAVRIFPTNVAAEIQAIVLAAVIVNEILGPVMAKIALTKAGEIGRNI